MTQSAYEISLEKSISLLVVSFILLALDWRGVMALFIVLGQAHFLLAYLYQFRAGKIDRPYLVRYFLSALFLGVFYFAFFHHDLLLLTTAIFFLQHALFDEFLLLREDGVRTSGLAEISPIFLLYAGILVDGVSAQSTSPWARWWNFYVPSTTALMGLLASLILLFYLYKIWTRTWRLKGSSSYFFCFGLALVLFAASGFGSQIPVIKLMGFIILYHYFNWYAHYWHKLSSDGGRSRRFLFEILVLHMVLILTYWLWAQGDSLGFAFMLFNEDCFYLWTLMHLVSSIRSKDFALGRAAV